jgi:hypothetical protein
MFNNALLLIMVLAQMSCTSFRPKEVNKYVDIFEKACNIKVTTPIFFVDIKSDQGTVGICWNKDKWFHFIEIDKSYWNVATDSERMQLVLHELGHCELKRDHDETTSIFFDSEHGIVEEPWSLMYPSLSFIDFDNRKQHYLDELCGRK